MKLKENFASVYSRWLPELVELEVPDEKWADCANCHICLNARAKQFNTKCCDYHPCLPNYVVGQILSDKSDENKIGRELIKKKIRNKTGVSPNGIYPPSDYQEKFVKSRLNSESTTQEQVTEIKCPYYLDGNCTIHKYRSDVCGTSFCISVSLSSGMRFWKAAKELNQFLDKRISVWVANSMGFNNNENPLTLQEILSNAELGVKMESLDDYADWGTWTGKVEEYYKKCYELFKTLNPEEFEKNLGLSFQDKKREVLSLYPEFISNKLPQLLILNEDKWAQEFDKSQFNSIDVWMLRLFDGKNKTDDIIKKALSLNVGLTKTLKSLIKKKILVEV